MAVRCEAMFSQDGPTLSSHLDRLVAAALPTGRVAGHIFFLNPPILVVCLAALSERIVYPNENPLLKDSLQSLILYLGAVPVTRTRADFLF